VLLVLRREVQLVDDVLRHAQLVRRSNVGTKGHPLLLATLAPAPRFAPPRPAPPPPALRQHVEAREQQRHAQQSTSKAEGPKKPPGARRGGSRGAPAAERTMAHTTMHDGPRHSLMTPLLPLLPLCSLSSCRPADMLRHRWADATLAPPAAIATLSATQAAIIPAHHPEPRASGSCWYGCCPREVHFHREVADGARQLLQRPGLEGGVCAVARR
jgi:hypothetical protein